LLKVDQKLLGILIAGFGSDANRLKRSHHAKAAKTLLLG